MFKKINLNKISSSMVVNIIQISLPLASGQSLFKPAEVSVGK